MKSKRDTLTLSDGAEVVVISPSPSQSVEGQKFYLRKWKEYSQAGVMTNKEMNDFVIQRGLITPERNAKIEKASREILDIKRKLKSGKKGYKTVDEASKAAFSIRDKHREILDLMNETNEFALKTAESLAEVDRFNFLLTLCVFKNDELYFEDLEDYLERQDEEDILRIAAKFAALTSPYTEETGLQTDEDKFLYKYGFVDDKGRRINKQGKLVDDEGRLINEVGRYVDESGEYVDINGSRIDEDGNPVVDFEDFTDESGEVIKPKSLPA
jgi:hypothetical protein